MGVKLAWQERGWIVKLCQDYGDKTKAKAYSWKRPKSLAELLKNVKTALPYLRGSAEMICMQLQEYLTAVVREIGQTEFSSKLELEQGINVMDVTELSDGLKALVIRSVIEWVHKRGRKIVVIIPEAWKFIPEGRSTPVKLALEGLIREGAGVGNFVWMDSQDLRGVDKLLLRSVIVWLFGVQRQKNEVASTLASIPDHPKPSATEVMQLGKGEFFVAYGSTLIRTYVQPAGMEDAHAQAIARGEESPDSWRQIARALDEETETQEKGQAEDEDNPETASSIRGLGRDVAGGEARQGIPGTNDQEPRGPNSEFTSGQAETGHRTPGGTLRLRDEDHHENTNQLAESSERQTPPGEALEGGDRENPGREREARGQAERDAAPNDATGTPSEAAVAPERHQSGAFRLRDPHQQLQILDQVSPEEDAGPGSTCSPAKEDQMWKEKYEALKKDYDALSARLSKLEPWNDSPADVSAPAGENGAEGSARNRALGPSASFNEEKMYVLGESTMMDIYDYVRARAEKDPGILDLLARRPELRVTVERPVVEANSKTLRGALAVLISERFFDTPKNGNTAFNELKRRGKGTAKPNVYRELDELAEMGFVTKEETGYQAVPGMKVHIIEEKSGKAVAAR